MTEPSRRAAASRLIEALVDAGTWRSWDEPVTAAPADPEYLADLAKARARTGLDESVVTGEGLIRGRRATRLAARRSRYRHLGR